MDALQPRLVRESYVREVVDRGERVQCAPRVWMLRQRDSVRDSYVRYVLEPGLDGGKRRREGAARGARTTPPTPRARPGTSRTRASTGCWLSA